MSESPRCEFHFCAYCNNLFMEIWKTVAGRTGTNCPKCGVMREDEKVFVWINNTKETQSYWEQIPEGTLLILDKYEYEP